MNKICKDNRCNDIVNRGWNYCDDCIGFCSVCGKDHET